MVSLRIWRGKARQRGALFVEYAIIITMICVVAVWFTRSIQAYPRTTTSAFSHANDILYRDYKIMSIPVSKINTAFSLK